MEEGLAQNMVYGSGSGNTTKHHYAGVIKNKGKKLKKPYDRKKVLAFSQKSKRTITKQLHLLCTMLYNQKLSAIRILYIVTTYTINK